MKSQAEQGLKVECVRGGKHTMLANSVVTKKVMALQFHCCSFNYG
jgi:hypothetical protein